MSVWCGLLSAESCSSARVFSCGACSRCARVRAQSRAWLDDSALQRGRRMSWRICRSARTVSLVTGRTQRTSWSTSTLRCRRRRLLQARGSARNAAKTLARTQRVVARTAVPTTRTVKMTSTQAGAVRCASDSQSRVARRSELIVSVPTDSETGMRKPKKKKSRIVKGSDRDS